MTEGEYQRLQNKHDDLFVEHQRLKELYALSQNLIEYYRNHFTDKNVYVIDEKVIKKYYKDNVITYEWYDKTG